MKTVLSLVALALLVPLTSSACDLVNAKITWGGFEPCIPQAGMYITIGSAGPSETVTDCGLNGSYPKYIQLQPEGELHGRILQLSELLRAGEQPLGHLQDQHAQWQLRGACACP